MPDPYRLSPEMLANLRAIRAGEPWPHPGTSIPRFSAVPPNDLVPNTPWRLTEWGVAVLALADERDALRSEVADLLPEADAMQHMRTRAARAEAEVERLRAAPVSEIASLRDFAQRVNHALSDRLKPGQGEIQAIIELFADLDRAKQRAEAAEARLTALLAPVGAVAVDAHLDPTCEDPLHNEVYCPTCEHYPALSALAHEVTRLRDLCRRLLPARYLDADGKELDPDRCTPHATDCAECGRGRAHDEACLATLPTPAEEIATLRAERDAYRKAKKENDERYMLEAGQQRRRADAAEQEVGRLQSALGGEIAARQAAETERNEARNLTTWALDTPWSRPDHPVAALVLDRDRLRAEVTKLTRERDQTLAAEHGRPEGAPSKDWKFVADKDFDERGDWVNRKRKLKVWWVPEEQRWVLGERIGPGCFRSFPDQPKGQGALAAMLSAEPVRGTP